MSQKEITLRNVNEELRQALEEHAGNEGKSVEELVVDIVRQDMVKRPPRATPIGHRLDPYIGMWTREQADEFNQALAEQRWIDPELWE